MFWWLHYTTAQTPQFTDRPLILWLQGGPGSSSTGYGNFEILGPLDLDLNERSFTWIKTHNVLFVDNPVGTGYSYVDHNKYLTKDNQQIARDLVELLRGFYVAQPDFRTVPLHIFGESYGGKMAIEFAHELYTEIAGGRIESNLITVAMGDAWISPIDSTLSWAPYLFQLVSKPNSICCHQMTLKTLFRASWMRTDWTRSIITLSERSARLTQANSSRQPTYGTRPKSFCFSTTRASISTTCCTTRTLEAPTRRQNIFF